MTYYPHLIEISGEIREFFFPSPVNLFLILKEKKKNPNRRRG
jgi:hypothetical protein